MVPTCPLSIRSVQRLALPAPRRRRLPRPGSVGRVSCLSNQPKGFLEYEEKLTDEDMLVWRERLGDKPKPSVNGQQRAKRVAKKLSVEKHSVNAQNRLSKVLAAAGVDSRRKCEDIITAGRVKVNNKVVTVPQTQVSTAKDRIVVDGRVIRAAQTRHYFIVHKPKGYFCSNEEREGLAAKPVVSILDPFIQRWLVNKPVGTTPPRLFTVGRLDANTTGMILVTNDGKWAQRVSHPSSGVVKEYIAKVSRNPTEKQLGMIAAGCVIDGSFVRPLYVDLAARDATAKDRVCIVLQAGGHQEVKKLIESVGLDCVQLKRSRIGGLVLPPKLKQGQYRELTKSELKLVTSKSAGKTAIVTKVSKMLTYGMQTGPGSLRKIPTGSRR